MDVLTKICTDRLVEVIDKQNYEHNKNQLNEALKIKENTLRRSNEFVLKNKKLREKIDFDVDMNERAHIYRNSKNPRLKDRVAVKEGQPKSPVKPKQASPEKVREMEPV